MNEMDSKLQKLLCVRKTIVKSVWQRFVEIIFEGGIDETHFPYTTSNVLQI